jgi:predicted patatin/cPLA2 family phospholipase
MHQVLVLLRNRAAGKSNDATLAIVARGGGQRWVTAAGITTLFRLAGIEADIIGGTSGGALALLFYADGGCSGRAMVLRCLTSQGFARDGGAKFIQKRRLLQGQPPMNLVGLFDDAFTLRYPLLLEGLAASQRPIFVTATQRDGTGVTQRLDGTTAAFCREAAINTARLPLLAHDPKDTSVLWDGSLSNDAPIDEAFRLGASHVLVINPRGANQGSVKPSLFDRLVMEPALKRQAPDLHKLWMNRHQNGQITMAKYADHPRVLQWQLPKVLVKNQTTDEKLLSGGVKAGWHYAAEALGLAQSPAYPANWVPVFQEHGLL